MTLSKNNTQPNIALLLCWVSRLAYSYAECHYAEWRYAEWRDAVKKCLVFGLLADVHFLLKNFFTRAYSWLAVTKIFLTPTSTQSSQSVYVYTKSTTRKSYTFYLPIFGVTRSNYFTSLKGDKTIRRLFIWCHCYSLWDVHMHLQNSFILLG